MNEEKQIRNKDKKSRKGIRIIIGIILLLIIAAVVAAAIFIKNGEGTVNGVLVTGQRRKSEKPVYTSIGDSIAAGYALPDYVADGEPAPSSFAAKFGNEIGAGKFNNLAVSGSATADTLERLESDAAFSDAIKESDVITIALGSNDILGVGVPLVFQATGVSSYEELAALFDENKDSIFDLLGILTLIDAGIKSDEATDIFNDALVGFENNFNLLIDEISAMNPNARIYVINYYNPFASFVYGDVDSRIIDIGDIAGELLDYMNEYIETHHYNGTKFFVVDVSDIDDTKTNVTVDLRNMVFSLDPHPNTEGHEYIYTKLLNAYKLYNDKTAYLAFDGDGSENGYYDSISDAWRKANTVTGKNATLTLLDDWNAEDGMFGDGFGFGESGAICPVDRADSNTNLVLDLSGYSINRGLDAGTKSGEVINIGARGIFTIKNGTVTGGSNTKSGGGILLSGQNTTLNIENMTISGNKAALNGGGIYCARCKAVLNIANSVITGNKSEKQGGGAYIDAGFFGKYVSVNLYGNVNVSQNEGNENADNITLKKGKLVKAYLGDVFSLSAGAQICVNVSGGNGGDITKPAKTTEAEATAACFACDNGEYSVCPSADKKNSDEFYLKITK